MSPSVALVTQCRDLLLRSRRIVVLSGAGISTSAGIPDFRSPDSVLYAGLDRYALPYPEAIFELEFLRENPEPFFHLAGRLLPGAYAPTEGHQFIADLERAGKLLRLFTQNIDGLDRMAGTTRVVECHGSFHSATCLACGRKYPLAEYREPVLRQEVPRCACPAAGVIKPDVVFFGEALPVAFFEHARADLPVCDLLLVIGSSLTVYPVAGLVEQVPRGVPRVLLNRERTGHRFDLELLGELDDLCAALRDSQT